ncbi:PIN domain-containing protein [Kribbella swartbergensis]
MPEPVRRAFLDANVLRGHLQTDVLLTLADFGAFHPRWSAEVLDEVRRNRPSRLPEEAIERRLTQMNLAFPQAMVTGYEYLEAEMHADEKDKHVLAAAVHSRSAILVTENVKDFTAPTSGPHAIRVERTSRFLNHLLEDNPQRVIAAMREMISRTRREPNSMSALIDKLASRHDLRSFAQNLNSVVALRHPGTHSEPVGGHRSTSARSVALDDVAPPTGAAQPPTAPLDPLTPSRKHEEDRGLDREA